MTKRKVTLELIEDVVDRRACFRKRQKGLLKKMEELSILCDVGACAIIDGPCDNKPSIWPSQTVAEDLLQRFQEAPEMDRFRNKVNQRDYMQEKTKKVHDQLSRLKKRNDEKDMSVFMHRIYDDANSLSDFEVSDLKRLLCYAEEKLKGVRKKINHLEKVVPPPNPNPNPNPNPPSDDMESWFNKDEQVSELQPLIDLLERDDQVNSNGTDNNNGSNMGLLPLADDLGDIDIVTLSQGNFDWGSQP